MKKISYIIVVFIFLIACDSENAPDCFQRGGRIIQKEIQVSEFKRILVLPNIELVLKQGNETRVVIQSGDNLINEVSAVMDGDQLILSNTNDCNFVRSFNQTKVFVTAPNIIEISSATQYDISSDGVLQFPKLKLISEDFFENSEGNLTSTFNLNIDMKEFSVVSNGESSFFVRGKVENLSVNFAGGIGRFEGGQLIAQGIKVFHRGNNKIIVNPQQRIRGQIRSTGDIIAVNRPAIVDVDTFFTGRLIFIE